MRSPFHLSHVHREPGKDVHAVSGYLNAREVAEVITRVSGKKCNYTPVTKEEFYTEAFKEKTGIVLWLKFVT